MVGVVAAVVFDRVVVATPIVVVVSAAVLVVVADVEAEMVATVSFCRVSLSARASASA